MNTTTTTNEYNYSPLAYEYIGTSSERFFKKILGQTHYTMILKQAHYTINLEQAVAEHGHIWCPP